MSRCTNKFKLFLFIAVSVIFSNVVYAEQDPILSDEPTYSNKEQEKQKKLRDSIDLSQTEKGYTDEYDIVQPIYEFSALFGMGYGKYTESSNILIARVGGNRLGNSFAPPAGSGMYWALHGGFVNYKRTWGMNLDYRSLSVTTDGVRGYSPKSNLLTRRTRLSATFDYFGLWKGILFKLGYSMWGRNGTATRDKVLTSHYTAHGLTAGLGYRANLLSQDKLVLTTLFLIDQPFKYSEKTAATGNDFDGMRAYELNLRLRWQPWRKVGFELTPYARYEVANHIGRGMRGSVDAKEEDISFAVPVGVFYQF